MKTIIRVYKNRNDYALNKPLKFRFCGINENEDYNPAFISDYMRGITEGLRCKYVAPVAVAFRINPDGTESVLNLEGGQHLI